MSEPLKITKTITIPQDEIELSATLAGGPGGQHVNKVSTAIELRFDIDNSSLPPVIKERLLKSRDRRITREGIIVIRARQHRSQLQNREAALTRLAKMIAAAAITPKKRIATKPSISSREKRLKQKAQRSRLKQTRRPPQDE